MKSSLLPAALLFVMGLLISTSNAVAVGANTATVHERFPSSARGVNASKSLISIQTTGMSIERQLLFSSLAGYTALTQPIIYIVDNNDKVLRARGTPTGSVPVSPKALRDAYNAWEAELATYWGVTLDKSCDTMFSLDADKYFTCVMGKIISATSASSGNVYVRADNNQREGYGVALMLCGHHYTTSRQANASTTALCAVCLTDADCKALSSSYGFTQMSDASSPSATYSNFYRSIDLPMFFDRPDGTRPGYALLQNPGSFPAMADFAVFCRCPVFFTSKLEPPADMYVYGITTYIHSDAFTAAVYGWGPDEHDTVKTLTQFNEGMVASDWSHGMSTFANFQLGADIVKDREPKPEPVKTKDDPIDNRHVATFVMTDGDNLQWLMSAFSQDAKWYGSPQRGSVPMGWTLSSALVGAAPPVLHRLMRTATSNDTFVSGVSGATYQFVDDQGNGGYAATAANDSRDAYKASGSLDPTRFGAPASSTETKPWVINLMGENSDVNAATAASAFYLRSGFDAVFYYPYVYNGLHGAMWRDPQSGGIMIGARYQLWSPGFKNNTQMIEALNDAPMDVTSPTGYSLIDVHAWSHQYSDVVDIAKAVNGSHVRIVTPDEFVRLVKKNVKF
eukprot:PhM_4_TR19122/c0_g1_i1/m.66854